MLRNFIAFLLLGSVVAAPSLIPQAAHADEFTTVAAGDPLYSHLAAITKAGWIGESPSQGASHSLTRYEMALETAKAIFTVTAQRRVDAEWATTAPKAAVRSLRELTVSLRPELKQLDIDVNATLALFDGLLKPTAQTSAAGGSLSGGTRTGISLSGPNPIRNGTANASRNNQNNSGISLPAFPGNSGIGAASQPHGPVTNFVDASMVPVAQSVQIPLSQRLRVDTTIQALAQEENDPLRHSALTTRASSLASTHSGGSQNMLTARSVGTSFDISRWLRVRAGYDQQSLLPHPYSLREALFADATQTQSVGGGVDVRLLRSLTFSGNVAKVSGNGNNPSRATRVGGGVGLSGWQNRLSLNANLSRLMPEDSLALSSTAAGLNMNLDVTERLSLNLLYQQMFGAQAQPAADRVVAGGISINF